MAVHYRTRGFVLSKTDFREADQLFNVFTEDFGKLEILGKAIRKIKSKLRSGIDLFYLSEIEFIQGKTYKTLTDAFSLEKFNEIRNNLEKLKTAFRITEIADSLIKGEEKDERIFILFLKTFQRLKNLKPKEKDFSETERERLELVFYYFLWNLFSILGYGIDLYSCVRCSKKLIPEKLKFSPEDGGIICKNCSKRGEEIFPETIKLLRVFAKDDWETLLRLKVDKKYLFSLEKISKKYLFYIQS